MERIGIYGGTFNPPHIGHIQAAVWAKQALGLNRLLLIPDRIAPHKTLPEGSPSPEQRLAMLQLAASGHPELEVSDMELRRSGPSYTYQTVLELKERFPEARLVLIMGTDMFLALEDWKNPDILLKNAEIGVLYRGAPGEAEKIACKKKKLAARGAAVTLAENGVLPVSSTDVRRMLAFSCGEPYLPAGVGEYIRANGLYGVGKSRKELSMAELERVAVSLLDPHRVPHVLGCRDAAVELAKRYGADVTDAARAALLHDITKALSQPYQLTLCREYGSLPDDFTARNSKIIHAFTGALVAKRIFGESPQVVSAIRWHTTGRMNMTDLEKIIYVADYMEPTRDFPGVERLREAARESLNGAMKLGLEMTVAHLKERGSEISPASQEALEWIYRKE